ncbi:MAG TPA: lipocalin family protein [Gammaproteobacteria bacterium]|nr:lipocalin family protein [Gammaproteobacteria bacterium]
MLGNKKIKPGRLNGLFSGFIILAVFSVAGCSLVPPPGFPQAEYVDIPRYMGPWYVIATIPPGTSDNAYNALECYKRIEPGEISTVFTFREGNFDGERHTFKPTGYIIEGTGNAVWGMQFFWPLKMQYVISYVSDDYQTTIIARSDRDYVWIMARTPNIPDATYENLVKQVEALGYDMSKLRKVPQQPLSKRDDGCN